MKKCVLFLGIMIILSGMLSACGNKITTYTYENEAVLKIRIKKTEVYPDRLVVTFAKDSLSGVEDVNCFQSDFSALEVEPEFSFAGDALTIETDDAARISGLRVWESDRDLYFDVRYLDSDSYAMLVSAWADDIGYMVNGDTDAYYTQEEKDAQRELEEQQAEAEAQKEHHINRQRYPHQLCQPGRDARKEIQNQHSHTQAQPGQGIAQVNFLFPYHPDQQRQHCQHCRADNYLKPEAHISRPPFSPNTV